MPHTTLRNINSLAKNRSPALYQIHHARRDIGLSRAASFSPRARAIPAHPSTSQHVRYKHQAANIKLRTPAAQFATRETSATAFDSFESFSRATLRQADHGTPSELHCIQCVNFMYVIVNVAMCSGADRPPIAKELSRSSMLRPAALRCRVRRPHVLAMLARHPCRGLRLPFQSRGTHVPVVPILHLRPRGE